MELSEFIRQTIEGIAKGVKAAHPSVEQEGAWIGTSEKVSNIEFDIAVVTTKTNSEEQTHGGAIQVVWLTASGKGKSKSDIADSYISRIRFGVPMAFPESPKPSVA